MKVLSFIDVYLKNYKRYKEKWNYEDGCVLEGALDLFEVTKDEKYKNFVLDYLDSSISSDGKIMNYEESEYNIDNIKPGKSLFDALEITGDNKFRIAIEETKNQIKNHPRTKEGSFWHKKIYPNQVWLDGLYMAYPFYAKYEKLYSNSEGFNDIYKQYLIVKERIKDSKTGLYYHGYDESREERWSNKETGCSENFWSRAMGWFVMSMVDTLEIMGQDYEHFEEINKIFNETISDLLKYQDEESGMWYQVTDQGHKEDNYLETSGTLMIGYSILKGVRLGFLPVNLLHAGKKSINGTIDKYLDLENNELGGICGVAGLGNTPYRDGTYEYYISERIIPNDPKGVGSFMMAYSELLRVQ